MTHFTTVPENNDDEDDRQTRPAGILASGAETYERKQKDYGDSWRLTGQVLYDVAGGPITLETPEDFIAFGLYTRRLDKVFRAFNGEFVMDDMNFESVKDSLLDEMVYSAMHATNQEDRQP